MTAPRVRASVVTREITAPCTSRPKERERRRGRGRVCAQLLTVKRRVGHDKGEMRLRHLLVS
jgi:hypothetical protein